MYTLEIKEPNKLYFTSDTHFGHFNICKYCHRPFGSRSEMDTALINNWNEVVPEDGIVIHCGDFTLIHKESLVKYQKILNKLNGQVLLCRGNHDMIPLTNEPIGKLIAVVDIAKINVDGISIIASHYPMLAYPSNYQVYGHIHTLSDGTCQGIDSDVNERLRLTQYDVGVDQNGYAPISFLELYNIFNKKRDNSEKFCHDGWDIFSLLTKEVTNHWS